MSRREIASHTGLRGIAALVVVLFHLQAQITAVAPAVGRAPALDAAFLMVDLFFVLSGFILCHVYAAELSTWDAGAAARFYRARFARIYPLHLTTLAATVAIFLGAWTFIDIPPFNDGMRSPETLLSNLLLVQAWGLHQTFSWNVPAWSISAEMAFYASFPLVALAMARVAALPWLLAAGIAAGYAAIFELRFDTLAMAMPRMALGCAAGVLLFQLRHASAALSDRMLSLLQLAALAAGLAAMQFSPYDMPAVVPLAALVWLTWEDRGRLAAWLGRPGPQYLGRISYSLYLVHPCVWLALRETAVYGADNGWFARTWPVDVAILALSLGLVFLFSDLSYRLVEMPARRWLRQLGRRPAAA